MTKPERETSGDGQAASGPVSGTVRDGQAEVGRRPGKRTSPRTPCGTEYKEFSREEAAAAVVGGSVFWILLILGRC